jgi:Protein of unknown function (DUF1349)
LRAAALRIQKGANCTIPARREFLSDSFVIAGAAAVPSVVPSPVPSPDLVEHMTWFNPPASWKKSDEQLLVQCRPKTDFWRKTFYGYITDNGHFFYLPLTGDVTFQARVNGKYAALYKPGGLDGSPGCGKLCEVWNRVS